MGGRRFVICCGFAVVALVSVRCAWAAEVSLWPMVEFDELYDNNVDLTPTSRKGDFVTSEAFGATLETSTAARDIFLTYQTHLLEYASYHSHDSFGSSHFANLKDEEKLSPATKLSISDNLLVGNAVSSGILVNGVAPIGTQLMQSLFYQSSTLSNSLSLDLFSNYNNSFRWTANVHQNLFTTLSGSSSISGGRTSPAASNGSGNFFNQGGALGGEWDLPERFAAGFGNQFDDFRSSAGNQPSADTNWPQFRMRWGGDTPLSFSAQVGPVVAYSSSGSLVTTGHRGMLRTTSVPAQTKLDFAYFVGANYRDRRLTVIAYAAQQPGYGAGFAFATNQQRDALLINYQLSRRATLFANGGYYTQSNSGVSEEALTYTSGMTYRLNQYFILSANYLGFQTTASGSAALGHFVAVPGKRSTVNVFQVGITFAPPPLQWRPYSSRESK
jgi:hypothetical protein